MNDDNQQTTMPVSVDPISTSPSPAPADPMTGADVAEQAKDIAEHDLSNMVPAMPESEPEASDDSMSAESSAPMESSMAEAPASDASSEPAPVVSEPMPEASEPAPVASEAGQPTDSPTDTTPPVDTSSAV